jgi:hypothetical protein
MKPDFHKELSLGFGYYCEVYDGTNNTTKSRSIPCIALYPCCNVTSSWAFYSLTTKIRIRRTQWKKMATMAELVVKMNALDPDAAVLEPVGGNDQIEDQQPGNTIEAESEDVGVTGESNNEPSRKPLRDGNQIRAEDENKEENGEDMPELVDQEDDESDYEADDDLDSDDDENGGDSPDSDKDDSGDEEDDPGDNGLQRSNRIRKGARKPQWYMMVTKNLWETAAESDEQKHGLERAKVEEIKLVFEDLKVMEPVKKEEISAGYTAHNTHLFMVEKFTADGKHDKYKSRLVAHGYESSPTVAIQSLMTCLTMAACNSNCVVGKLDVKDAFIQTEMKSIPVYIQCRGKLKDLVLQIILELSKYVGSHGVLTVDYGRLCMVVYRPQSYGTRSYTHF